MSEIAFTAQQLPNKKWRLTQTMLVEEAEPHEQDRGVYDSPALAGDAVKIILNPQYVHWDQNGDEMK